MRKNNREKGQVLYLLAIGLVALLGFAGLAIDGGRLYSEKRDVQGTSDTSALTGGLYLTKVDGAITEAAKANAIAAAKQRAVENGYDINDVTVTITEDGVYYYVTSTINSAIDPTIIQLVYNGPLAVTADSVARVQMVNQFALGKALFSINETECKSMRFQGNADTTIIGSGIFSNSSCEADPPCQSNDDATLLQGSSQTTIGGTVASVGGVCDKHNSLVSDGVLTGQTQVKLPTLTEPDCSGLPTFTSDRPADGSTFQPGIYTNGIHLNGNDSFSFDPGLYCLDGEFQINSKNAAAVGNAVTFFMRGNSGLHFNGGDIDLRAPHNNEWKDGANRYWNGMLFFFAYGNTNDLILNGNEGSYMEGTVFSYDGDCELMGTGDTVALDLQLVCNTIDLSGTADLMINYNDSNHYLPPQAIDLVE